MFLKFFGYGNLSAIREDCARHKTNSNIDIYIIREQRRRMNTQDIIELATQYLADLSGHTFDLLNISRPISPNSEVSPSKPKIP